MWIFGHSGLARQWVRWLSVPLLVCFFFTAFPATLNAQSNSTPSIVQLLQTMNDLLSTAQTLRSQLQSSQAKTSDLEKTYQTLKTSYAALQGQLTQAVLSSENSAKEITRLSALSNELKTSLDQLSRDFTAYKKQADSNLHAAELKAATWELVAKIAVPVAVGVGFAWFVVDIVLPAIRR